MLKKKKSEIKPKVRKPVYKVDYDDCGNCDRYVFKKDEPSGKFVLRNNKIVCVICRATKFSKFKKQILSSKERMMEDLKTEEDKFNLEEDERVNEMAARSLLAIPKEARM